METKVFIKESPIAGSTLAAWVLRLQGKLSFVALALWMGIGMWRAEKG